MKVVTDQNGKVVLTNDKALGVTISEGNPNAVLYIPQTLTSIQQQQARTNIGATESEIFWAEYGTTTAAEIDAAISSNKTVLCRYNNQEYSLVHYNTTDDYIYFGASYVTNAIWLRVQRSNDAWVSGLQGLESVTNKVTTLSSQSTDTQYPSAKAVYDELSGISTVGRTNDYTDLDNKPDLTQFITKSVNDLVNYYTTNDTYNKTQVNQMVSAIKSFEYVLETELPTASADTMYKIYLIPSADPQASNVKDEYITIDYGNAPRPYGLPRFDWEQIGSTAIDLSDYVTTTTLNTALANYTTTTDLMTLLNAKQDNISVELGGMERFNVSGGGSLTITGTRGQFPKIVTPGTYTVITKMQSTTTSYGVTVTFGSNTYTINTTNGNIDDERELTLAANATWSGSVVGSVAANTHIYISIIGEGAVTTLSNVAVTGSYNDLSDKPSIPAAQQASDWNATSGVTRILNKPSLSAVATSGSYNDLTNKPSIPSSTSELTNDSGFITSSDIPEGAAASNTVPLMDGTANKGNELAFARGDHVHPTDTSRQAVISDLEDIRAGAALGTTALQSFTETDPTVPAWAKASSKPTYTAQEVGALPSTTVIPAAPGTLNTTATSAQDTSSSEALSSNITLHKVSKTGSYNDLNNKPTIPAAQVNADWDALSGVAQILNKPTIPTVPTNVSAFTNDAGYGTYSKPSGGIPMEDLSQTVRDEIGYALQAPGGYDEDIFQLTPDDEFTIKNGGIAKTKLASAVQTSLGKADTALQSYTETDPTVPAWAKAENKPSYTYSEISNTPDLSQFITKSVNDLTNYYTKDNVDNLIGAIQQFHYEIAATTSAVTNPQSNILYLIGPTGSGADKYEEYVYSNSSWVKIGDTSIDLSGYITTQALNTTLSAYTTTTDLNTLLNSYVLKSNAVTNVSYNTSSNKLQKTINGTTSDVVTFGSNAFTSTAIPTKVSDITNDSGFITGITSSDVTSALGFTPYKATNPNGYTSNVGTVTSVNNISPVNGNVTISIPSEVTESTISGWGFTKNAGTLTGITMNGDSVSVYNGVANLGTVITAHQDISGKQDKIDASHKLDYSLISNTPTIPVIEAATTAEIDAAWNSAL